MKPLNNKFKKEEEKTNKNGRTRVYDFNRLNSLSNINVKIKKEKEDCQKVKNWL